MSEKRVNAWALRIHPGRLTPNPGFCGVYYFTGQCEPWHDGMRTALFRTRSQARAASVWLRARGRKTTPVLVCVSIWEISR